MLDALKDLHRRTARVAGALSLIIVRRKVSREMIEAWATELEMIAQEMRGLRK